MINKPNSQESKLLPKRNATSEKETPFGWIPMGRHTLKHFKTAREAF